MAHNEVYLQLGQLIGWDNAVFECAKAGSDAIHKVAPLHYIVNNGAGGYYALFRRRRQFHSNGGSLC
jgi:hypothetical protein